MPARLTITVLAVAILVGTGCSQTRTGSQMKPINSAHTLNRQRVGISSPTG